MAETDQGRELCLAPNEQMCILDKTNGNVYLYVGPKQDALANNMLPVVFSEKTKTFERCDHTKAVQKMTIAPEGWYVVLKNPAKDGKHPPSGQRSPMPELDTGRKINIPGPVAFATWPAQMVKVLPGHTLRSNQYLLVRVYDQDAARKNWSSATIQTVDDKKEESALGDVSADQLRMGQLIVIRGTHVSFFIPPTGLEVVRDESNQLVRDAVTLERLEYCMLLDESGNKRYVTGPKVVFPRPTEIFQTRQTTPKPNETPRSTRKFKGIELTPTSGIHVKVTADYTDEVTNKEHKLGEELFFTGKDIQIYFPREEHAIIRYREESEEVHYATAIPAGEGRYVMNRLTGKMRTVFGPEMFLPDPREEIIVRRILDLKTCELLYPGNREALAYNAALLGVPLEERTSGGVTPSLAAAIGVASAGGGPGMFASNALYMNEASAFGAPVGNNPEARGLTEQARAGFTGDRFQRRDKYTEPKTLTLNTKYAGVVSTSLWTGYAIMLVSKSGDRRVEQGPKTVMLAYEEEPQVLSLSTGKPKTTDTIHRDVFLKTHANMVSDVVEVETKDFCKLEVKLSYRVNFEGEPTKWFSIENYVKFLCDHLRSRLRNAVRKLTIEEFYTSSESIIRDIVVGKPSDPASGKASTRPGTTFEENGMRVYDVEVLKVEMKDAAIEKLLVSQQREAMNHTLQLASARRNLEFTIQNEEIKQKALSAEAVTKEKETQFKKDELDQKTGLDLATIAASQRTENERIALGKSKEEAETVLHGIRTARKQVELNQANDEAERQALRHLRDLEKEVEAVVKRGAAITPDLIAALTAFGERLSIERLAEAMAPLSIIGGGKRSVTEIFGDMLKGTPLAKHLLPSNGTSEKPQARV